jgi:Protein of unknown function (DUF2510)
VSSPGWFPDPLGRFEYRYFNGREWTADVSRGGQVAVDPNGARPTPAPAIHTEAPAPTPGRGFAVAALVTGIGALLTAWVPIVVVVGFALAVLAVVFGAIARRRAAAAGAPRSMSTTGLVLGIVGLLLVPVGVVLSVVVMREVVAYIEPGPHSITSDGPCSIEAGTVIFTGTITNLDDRDRGYTIVVRVRLDDRGSELRNVEVDDVAPGSTAPWRMVSLTTADTATCVIDQVYGPLPFGLPVES